MISVRSRDARKGLGLRFGGGGGGGGGRIEMEESELEEGEACSYQNHEDYDSSIDPDVALSYIDEKIQDVLGHFQKDFEGGVSAENLGAKFGGYGSFLPTYQRSPVWSRPRTPPILHSQNTPRSPNNLQLEGGQVDPTHSSTATLSVRLGPSSASSSRLPAVKAPSTDDGINQEKFMATTSAEAFTSKYESANTKSNNIPDQKTLKVRLKMGTDNLSTRKNAAIYSGLGLDVSPSSSLDDSPSESEGISREPQDAPFESPTSILQIMTSLPMLLSPLPDHLIQLTEKESRAKNTISAPVHIVDQESSGMLRHESNIVKGDRKSGAKKMKSVERYGSSMEVKGGNNKNARNDIGVLSTKECGIDALTTEELVSNTLKLPLLSSSYSFNNDSVKCVEEPHDTLMESNKGMVRENTFSDQAQKERVEPSSDVNGSFEKAKGGSGRKVMGDQDNSSIDELSVYTMDDNPSGDRSRGLITAESVSKGRTALNIEHIEPPKKAYQKGSLGEQDSVTLPVVKEHPFLGGKKSKGSHGTMVMERGKETSRVGTPVVPKTKKSSDVDSSPSKNETDDIRIQKDHGKTRDTYRDFFGELEEEEDRMDSLGTPNEDKLKDSEVVERSTSAINCAVKERSGNKKVKKPSTFEAHPKTATNVVRSSGNVHVTDVDNGKGVPITGPPVVIEDDWVQCDRCQKWRLLPVGTNTDDLPEKWLCSMLYWLPDMNRCSVSEAETNKTLIAPEGQINLQNVSGSVMTGGTLSTVHHPDVNGLNPSLHAMPSGKKKIVKELSNSANKDSTSQLSSSVKKSLQSSVKSRSLNDVNKSPAVSEPDVLSEKHKSKQKIREHNSDRGDTKNLKMKSRRDPDQDCSRPSKKGKMDAMHSTDEEWVTDHSGTTRKVDHSSNSSFPTNSIGKDRPKHKERSSSRDSKYDAKNRLQVSVEKATDKGHGSFGDGSLDLGIHDTNDGVKKRKLKEYQDTQNGSTGHHLQESRISVKEEFSDCRKEKKARISKSEGRESSKSKGSGRSDKKVSHTKNQQLTLDPVSTLSHRSLDGMDCLKRDLGSVQASAAATSSSSKVSGSHKTKASFQEVKGSPVESVSSSPMRILNTDKFTNRELRGKDDSHDNGAVGSPRRCSDGEDDGGSDRSRTARKDKSLTMVHLKSHGSYMPDFQDKDVNHISDIKSKGQTLPSPDVTTGHFSNGGVDTFSQDRAYPSTELIKDQCQGEERPDDYHTNVSHPRKTGKGSTSRSKDNSQSCKSEFDAEKVKNTSSLSQLQDQSPQSEAKHRDGRNMLQKFGLKSDKSENINGGKKDYTGNVSNERRNKENQINNRGHDEVSVDAICKQEALTAPSQNQLLDCDAERSSKTSLSERTDQEVLRKAKPLPLPPSGGSQIETLVRCPRPVVGSHKGNGDMAVDPSKVDDAPKLQKKPTRKADNQNGTQRIGSRHPTHNGHRTNDLDAPSPIRRDSSSHAANNALKEAKDLKHLADRLKNSGSTLESTGLYFQAGLKFLHGASLLESGNNENAKHSEMIQSKQVYSSTAKLCEFCAHEYEKSKDMAAAALAYKCMEVAYMRVIYSSHTSASRDRHQLQTALQMASLGESPSSSASDVDNVNNCTTADKVASSKGVSSPLVAGTHVIAAQNRPKFVRLLNFAQDVNFAMEASRKSRIAFAVANASSGETKNAEGISPIKKALDFNFQDVEGLLRLVRLAMEAINR